MAKTNEKKPAKTKQKILGPAKTANYQFDSYSQAFKKPRDLPVFTFFTIQSMLMEPTVKLGIAIRAAVLQGAEIAYAEETPQGTKWKPGVRSESPVVAAFVLRQINRIWQHNLQHLLGAQIWGWAACEATYTLTNHGTVEIDRLLPAHARDVKALTDENGDIGGVRFLNIKQADKGLVDLACPKAIWHAYNPEARRLYGDSALLGAYSPWADKWLDGGALDVRRLFMHKDAYGGMDISYPDTVYTIPDGMGGTKTVYSKEIAQQIVEQAKAGSVTTRPAEYNADGKEMWVVTRASVPGNPQHILEFPKQLDVEILRGLEIPDDILTAEATGAWAGKQVPMMAFYQGLEVWLRLLLGDIDRQIIRPLVDQNFGNVWYELANKPLVQQAKEQSQESPQGGSEKPPQQTDPSMDGLPDRPQPPRDEQRQRQPQRMSLETAIGQGVLNAAELVKAARKVIDDKVGVECCAK